MGIWDAYNGYGGFGGFIEDPSTFSPEYKAELSRVGDSLTWNDWHGAPRGKAPADKVIRDLATQRGLNPNQVYWDVLGQPKAHQIGWRDRPMEPWEKDWGSYNWAFSGQPYEQGPGDNWPQWPKPQKSDLRSDLKTEKPVVRLQELDAEHPEYYLGSRRLAYEHNMNMERQVSMAKARAAEARRRGDAELADYIEGLIEVMGKDAAEGRPEGFKNAYWPMVQEEFGDERAGGPSGYVTGARLAFQGPPADLPIPDVDWDPVMQSIKDTGGYTLEGPDSGYMVSIPDAEERRPTDTVTPNTEADYRKRHWDQILADPDLYPGGWDNKGTFYNDLSRNDEDLYRTVGDAVTTDQESIYDLNRGQVLDTMDNPDTDRDNYNPLLVSPGPIASRNFAAAMREFDRLAGPFQPGSEDLAGYEQEQFPSPPRRLVKPRKKPPTPEQRKVDRKKLRDKQKQQKVPRESLDPQMLDERINIDSLIKNALSRYNGATPEQRDAGRKWYATARARAEELARRTGGDFSKAAAIIAAMSPQMEWEGNLNAAAHFLNTYNPASKGDWRRPNLSPDALRAWNDLSGGRTPETPEDFATLSKLNGTGEDADWAKEMAMEGRWGRASGLAGNKKYKYKGAYTGTGLPTLGDNVLRAMAVYDSQDPRKVLDYANGGPKIHSFWRNFMGDEDYVTIDKHMLRALERGFDEDPLLSYGSGKPEVTRQMTPEDKRVNELEALLGLGRTMKGDEQQSVPTGYNTYAEAIRRATAQANSEMEDPSQHVTPAQMQAIIWLQHKDAMDAFRKRKSQEAWEAKNPGKEYQPPGPSKYVPGVPTNGPAPDYYQSDEWADQNPYKGDVPRPHVPDFHGITMDPDNIPDPELGPEEMSVMERAPWAPEEWSQGQLPKAAGRWSRRRALLGIS